MAEAQVDLVAEILRNLVRYNADLNIMRDEIQGMESNLEVLQRFLGDYAQNQSRPNSQLDDLVNIVNRAQDAIDDYVIEKAKQEGRNLFTRSIRIFDQFRDLRHIAKQIQRIKVDIEKIDFRKSYGQILYEDEINTQGQVKQAPVVEEDEDVVGFDEPATDLINFLRNSSLEVDVAVIVGRPGIGKTTLANIIYKDKSIVHEFSHRAWAYLYIDSQVEDVFISILKQLAEHSEDIYKMTSSELALMVLKCLEEKKYLIVLDDVWRTEIWEAVRVALPNNTKGSRIVLTTPNGDVARNANANRNPYSYRLNPLSNDEGRKLLERKVFGENICPANLVAVLEQVADKCGGLPLAIVVIAGTMFHRLGVMEWWSHVADGVDRGEVLMKVITISFKILPLPLKLCFLYFGLLPRGNVDARKLIELWIAEGFIKDDYKLGLENTAAKWLDNLVDRNLVMATSLRSNGQIKTCCVHDILRDFCMAEASRQNLYRGFTMSSHMEIGNCRRIRVYPNDARYFYSTKSSQNLHTFLTFSVQKITLDGNQSRAILKAFKRIRVLEASSLVFTQSSRELKKLPLLRYIAISCDFGSIPSISVLSNLQTLIILTTKRTLIVDKSIWKLYQLRHLKTNVSAKLSAPPASDSTIGKENIQTLSSIDPESCTEEIFSRTPKLKKLGVRGKLSTLLEDDSSKLIQNLGKLHELQNLKLFNEVFSNSKVSRSRLSRSFPKMLAKLTMLTLSGTFIGWEHMSILGQLESLEVLKLKEFAFKGETWETNCGIFPSLIFLCILRTDLKYWGASAEQFPSLTRLVLKHCDQLVEVPSCLAYMHNLQGLYMYYCSKEAVQSAWEVQNKKVSGSLKITIYTPDMCKTQGSLVENRVEQDEDDLKCSNPPWVPSSTYLQRCRSYCLLFPPGYEFERDSMVQMWIAQEVVDGEATERLEDKGYICFELLLSHGDIQPSGLQNRDGHLKFKVSEHLISGHNANRRSLVDDFLIISNDGLSNISEFLQMNQGLRTLLLFGESKYLVKQVPRDLFLSLNLLRTLVLSGIQVSELPTSVGNLEDLRYFDLSGTLVKELPGVLCDVVSLQTLKLRDCSEFIALPKGMMKLINLRHLDLDIVHQLSYMPKSIGKLINLQTFKGFIVGTEEDCGIGELSQLNNITGSFSISCLENVSNAEEAKKADLRSKSYITKLVLRWEECINSETEQEILECLLPHQNLSELQIQFFSGSALPIWISDPSFTNLISITFYKCINCSFLPSIGNLRSLKFLNILGMDKVMDIDGLFSNNSEGSSHGLFFPELEKLIIDNMALLEKWTLIRAGDLPCLHHLSIRNCPKLVELPSMSSLDSLEYLELND